MLEALIASDFHLGKLARFFPNDHLERQIVEIRKAYQYAIENGIKYVIIPGDVSDTPTMEERAFMAFVSLVHEYDKHITSIYIQGNHDVQDIKKTSMDVLNLLVTKKFFKNFKLYLTPKQINLGGIVVNMLPYPCNESLPNKIDVDQGCLNFAHIERTGALMDNGRPSNRKSEHDFKCKKADYTISGHLHTYQEMKKQRTLFPGSIVQVKFNDQPKKGFVHLKAKYVEGRLVVTHKFIDSKPNFVLKRIVIEKESDWEQVENDKYAIYEVRLADGVIAPSGIRSQCPNIFSIIGSKLSVEDVHTDIAKVKQLPSMDITSGLSQFLKSQGIKKKNRKLGLELVQKERNRLGL